MEEANAMLTEAWPNPRDYYTQEVAAYSKVNAEWREHSRKLQVIAADMQAIALDIKEQIDRRGK